MKIDEVEESENGETKEAQRAREDNVSIHIFSVSATMVGVCLTGIGLFRVIDQLKNVNSIADNLLALDALGFLASCFLSYVSLRSRYNGRARRIEHIADRIFLTSLGVMAIIAGLIAYEIT